MSTAMLTILMTAGCNQMASSAANMEGVSLYQRGDFNGARQHFTEALAQNPEDADGYYNLAATYHRLGSLNHRPDEMRQAENLYNQCLDRHPDHAPCYRALTVLLVETGRPDAATRLLDGWSRRDPKSPTPKIELARLYQELGNREQATFQLHEALTVDSDNARALAALGKLREESGELQQALADYQRSLSVNPNQPQVQTRVATLQAQVGNVAHAPAPRSSETRIVNQAQRMQRY
ncbi:MAG: tetratricopeptide repeat protein [Pirellulales bacterium]